MTLCLKSSSTPLAVGRLNHVHHWDWDRYIWSTNMFCIQSINTYSRIDMFMICMYIWKIHLFVVPVPVSLCVVVIVIVGCYGWNTTWLDHRLTAEDAPGVDLQPHSTQACCAGDPKINGWNLQSSPMKRKEHDLSQTSMEFMFHG